jgi:hypothetical protein
MAAMSTHVRTARVSLTVLCACQQLSQEQQQQQQAAERDAYDGPRDIILVTDADTPTGELVTLQLILLR